MSIITVLGFKGGVAKTTTSIHLACYLARQDRSVILIDGDVNRSSLSWSKRGALPFPVADERSASKMARGFDNIVIDTAARPERDDLEALVAGCDLLVLPCTPDPMSLEALELTTQELAAIGATTYRILLTICPPRPSRDAEDAREYLSAKGLPILNSRIRRFKAYQSAALIGSPVYDVPRGRVAWRDYESAGRELLEGLS